MTVPTALSAVELVREAQERAMRIRPAVGGFPYLAECLRLAGVETVEVTVPSCTSVYRTSAGVVVDQGTPLATSLGPVAGWDADALVAALRSDQAGHTTYPQFMASAWLAGVLAYRVDLDARTCTYWGADPAQRYIESYPAVALPD